MSSRKKPAVFNMNCTNTAVSTAKKAATLLETEASGDKENLIERGHATLVLKAKIPIDHGSVVREKKMTDASDEKKNVVEATASEGKSQIHADDVPSNRLTKEKNKKKEAYKETAEDLTGQQSEGYWEMIAEKRHVAGKEVLDENEVFTRKAQLLNEEAEMLEKALSESTDVIELLNEIVAENGGFGSDADQNSEKEDSSESETAITKNMSSLKKPAVFKMNTAPEGKSQIHADDVPSNSRTKEKNKKKEAYKITTENLPGQPSKGHWELIAEKRRVALKEALDEKEVLIRKVQLLNEKVEMLKKALSESTDVIELLNEIVAENGGFGSDADQNSEEEDSSESKTAITKKIVTENDGSAGTSDALSNEKENSSESNVIKTKKWEDVAFGDDTDNDSDDSEPE